MAPLTLLCACALSGETETLSVMNYAREPIEAACARDAVLAEEGFALRGPLGRRGGASEFTALFNDDLPVRVIVRNADGTGEVSAFTRLPKDATPLERREASFAVEAADEAIYRSCTADGRESDGDIVIETIPNS